MERLENGHYIIGGVEVISIWAANKKRPFGSKLPASFEIAKLANRQSVRIETVPTEANTAYKTVNAYPVAWLNKNYPLLPRF